MKWASTFFGLLLLVGLMPPAQAASTPMCFGKPATIIGTAERDHLHGTGGDDVIVGLGGRDRIESGPGDDLICGGWGRSFENTYALRIETLIGGPGNDLIAGGPGDDLLRGGEGHDRLFGGDGNDYLFAEDGHDLLRGGSGSDGGVGGPGADDIFLGAGPDYASGGGENDLVRTGRGPDLIGTGYSFGDSQGGFLVAHGANGDGGNDDIDGGAGADFIALGPGEDAVEGGSGIDQMVLLNEDPFEEMRIDLDKGEVSGLGGDTVSGFEDISANSSASLVVVGDSGTNRIAVNTGPGARADVFSLGGDDVVVVHPEGAEVTSWFHGGDGSDHLYGGGGTDHLFGENGDDVLLADGLQDELDGGEGHDVCGDTPNQRNCESLP